MRQPCWSEKVFSFCFFSFSLTFSFGFVLYIMYRPFLLLDPSFIFFRPHSAVFQPVAIRCPKKFEKSFPHFLHIRKKCVPLHSLSGMTRGLMRKRSLKGLGYKTNTRRNIEASAGPFFFGRSAAAGTGTNQ